MTRAGAPKTLKPTFRHAAPLSGLGYGSSLACLVLNLACVDLMEAYSLRSESPATAMSWLEACFSEWVAYYSYVLVGGMLFGVSRRLLLFLLSVDLIRYEWTSSGMSGPHPV